MEELERRKGSWVLSKSKSNKVNFVRLLRLENNPLWLMALFSWPTGAKAMLMWSLERESVWAGQNFTEIRVRWESKMDP